jgi:ApbE superfamily uncharacterized protein (UPF0280 family)
MGPTRARLPDGRWHFQHGPIDCVIGADGEERAVEAAHEAAWIRFATILAELVAELPVLNRAVDRDGRCPLEGAVARSMWTACRAHADRFVTPMAAVAGAVADALIVAYRRPGIARAWVNNGGDIALHLADGAAVRVGLFVDLARFDGVSFDRDGSARVDVDGRVSIGAEDTVRGIATSGWRGRSFSLGIADAVTVLAGTAADADAAASLIANAVDLDDARIVRRPASSLKDDTDLGDHLVTVNVPALDSMSVRRALAAGRAHAETLRARGVIVAASIACQGMMTTVGHASDAGLSWHGSRSETSNRLAA